MRALVLGIAAAILVVMAGIVLAAVHTLTPARPSDSPQPENEAHVDALDLTTGSDPVGRSTQQRRDDLAATPLPQVQPAAAQPAAVSVRDPGTLTLPAATRTGPSGVPSGFPQTPSWALAQLAEIDQTAMQSGSLSGVRAVINAWALPGGPTGQSWSGVAAMAALLDAAGLSGGGSGQLALSVTPLMGLVKGQVGADFVIPCVDFEVDVTLAATSRTAAADCQRMVWTGAAWVVGPGVEPSSPPSVWPDTDSAIAVGYRDLRSTPTTGSGSAAGTASGVGRG
jgi:hypothetical protein